MRKIYTLFIITILASFTAMAQCDNQALNFTGQEYVEIPHAPELNLSTNWTMEALFNPKAINTKYEAILSKGSSPTRPVSLWYKDGKIEVWMSPGNDVLTSKDTLALNEWSHVAVTYDGDTMKLYLNGEINHFELLNTIPDTSTTNYFIGKRGDDNFFLNGSVDEVKLWSKVLSKEEIKQNSVPTLPNNDLIAYWDFTQNNNDTLSIIDKSSNAFNGEIKAGNADMWICGTSLLSIQEKTISPELFVYPNPATNSIVVPEKFDYPVEVYNTKGELVKTFESEEIEHIISDLNSGIYFLTNGTYFSKFIKE